MRARPSRRWDGFERNARAVDVQLESWRSSFRSSPNPEDGQNLGAKALFHEIDIIPPEAGLRENRRSTAGTGPMPMVAGWQTGCSPRHEISHRIEAEFGELVSATTRQAAAASFCWLALPAVTTPPFLDRSRGAERSIDASGR